MPRAKTQIAMSGIHRPRLGVAGDLEVSRLVHQASGGEVEPAVVGSPDTVGLSSTSNPPLFSPMKRQPYASPAPTQVRS
jgi:hypothetical protein